MYICSDHFTPESFLPIKGLGRQKLKPDAVPSIFPKFPQHLQVSPKPKWRSPKKCKIVEPPTPSKIAKEHLYACQSEFDPNKSKQEIVHLKKKVSVIFQRRVIEQGKGICFDKNLSAAIICLKLQIPYYHPLNQWLLGATNGNHGQAVIHLQCSETINHI